MPLHGALDGQSHYAPEYRGGLSSHLPMGLVALWRLGADDARLAQFGRSYAPLLEASPSPPLQDCGAAVNALAPDVLGQIAAYPRWRDHFLAQLGHQDIASVVRAALRYLMPGSGAAAFHGLIRTAFGVDAGHRGEVAAGLAYWAARYLPLTSELPPAGELACERWLAQIESALRGWRATGGLIFEDMQRIAADPRFGAHLAGLRVDDQTLGNLARFAARRYSASRDFTALHLVTSADALGRLLAGSADGLQAVHWYAVPFAAALATTASPGAVERPLPALLPWDEIVRRALRSDDPHVGKLVYSCRELERVYEGDEFRMAATVRVN